MKRVISMVGRGRYVGERHPRQIMEFVVSAKIDGAGPEPSEEEPCVEPDGRAGGSDRPPEVGETPERRRDPAPAHLVEGLARHVSDLAGCRDHDPGLLVRLAHRRDGKGGGGRGIPADSHGPEVGEIEPRCGFRYPIRPFHRPSGEHVAARQKLRVGVAAPHQTQGLAVAWTHDNQGRGVTWSNRHGRLRVVHRGSAGTASRLPEVSVCPSLRVSRSSSVGWSRKGNHTMMSRKARPGLHGRAASDCDWATMTGLRP